MKRITWIDRLVIEKLYNSGCSYRQISRKLGFAPSSVYAEVQRGLYDCIEYRTWKTIKRYSAQIADDDAAWQATARGCPIKLGNNHAYAETVSRRILAGESPDQIVGSLRRAGSWTVSTVTLYRYIDQGYIPGITNGNLLIKPHRKRPYHKVKRAAHAPKGQSIERRPLCILDRLTPGDWEMDTVIGKAKGKGQAILVLTERLTRYEIIVKLPNKTSAAVVSALSKLVPNYPKGTFRTITVDNGSEFQDYEGLKRHTREVYYCHPYCSSERGSNENANRIIRRYFPKGESLSNRTQRDCDAVADRMNQMHRKILDYATPAELFQEWQQTLQSSAAPPST